MPLAVVYAIADTSVILPSGSSVRILPGEHWPANDPLVEAHPDLFTDDPREVGLRISVPLVDDSEDEEGPVGPTSVVEQATAAPGEKRTTGRRRAAKKASRGQSS